jgi:hypothetical protein
LMTFDLRRKKAEWKGHRGRNEEPEREREEGGWGERKKSIVALSIMGADDG